MLPYTLKRRLWGDQNLLRSVVERSLSFDMYLVMDQRMIVCPFHFDSRPSAKFFDADADGIVRLHCFSENRQFTVYDYLTLVLGLDLIVELDKRVDSVYLEPLLRDIDVRRTEYMQQRYDADRVEIDRICRVVRGLENQLQVLYHSEE